MSTNDTHPQGIAGQQDATMESHEKPRHRFSCQPCRKRKTKCDKVEPCSSCVLRSTVSFCYKDKEGDSPGAFTTEEMENTYSADASVASSIPVEPRPSTSGLSAAAPAKRRKKLHEQSQTSLATTVFDRSGKENKLLIVQQIQSMRSSLVALESLLSESYGRGFIDEHDRGNSESRALGGLPIGTDHLLDRPFGSIPSGRPSHPSRMGAFDLDHHAECDIGWAELSPMLPSIHECDVFIDYYFSELTYYLFVVHRPTYLNIWQQLKAGHRVSRNDAAILVFMLSIVGLLIPEASPLLDSCAVSPRNLHKVWYRIAFQIVEGGRDPLSRPDNSFERVVADCLAVMYLTFAGLQDAVWEQIGSACRRAEALHLFDETHRAWRSAKLTDQQIEYRRRVAHQLMMIDRWQCWHFMRQWAIIPAFFRVDPPMFDPDDAYDERGMRKPDFPLPVAQVRLARVEFGDFLVQGVIHLRSLPSLSRQERYENTRKLVELVERNLAMTLASLGLTVDDVAQCRIEETKESHSVMAKAAIWFSSSYYLRCIIMRPFLEDVHAPLDIRFAALGHAKKVIECMPLVLTLSKSRWVPFHSSWTCPQMLAAATTFAIPFLSLDPEQQGSAADDASGVDARDATNLGATACDKLACPTSQSKGVGHAWPKEELDWFAEKVFDVLNALTQLGNTGNHAAKVGQNLLYSLVTGRKELQKRYAARKAEDKARRKKPSGKSMSAYGAAAARANGAYGAAAGRPLNDAVAKLQGIAGSVSGPGSPSRNDSSPTILPPQAQPASGDPRPGNSTDCNSTAGLPNFPQVPSSTAIGNAALDQPMLGIGFWNSGTEAGAGTQPGAGPSSYARTPNGPPTLYQQLYEQQQQRMEEMAKGRGNGWQVHGPPEGIGQSAQQAQQIGASAAATPFVPLQSGSSPAARSGNSDGSTPSFLDLFMMSPTEWAEIALGLDVNADLHPDSLLATSSLGDLRKA